MVKLLIKLIFTLYLILLNIELAATEDNFKIWLEDFKKVALAEGISKNTVNENLQNIKFLPKVIEYDRYQP